MEGGESWAGSERIPAWEVSVSRPYLLVTAEHRSGAQHPKEKDMTTITSKIIKGIAVTAAAAAISVGAATTASAVQTGSYPLSPGTGQCTNPQYAGYQVRAVGVATGQGAKFKLLRNGVVIANTDTRSGGWSIELRSAYGNFPGPGSYSLCAQNTGTTNTIATLTLRTDSEV